MFNPGTWSVGGKVILPVAVGRDKVKGNVLKESSGRPSEIGEEECKV